MAALRLDGIHRGGGCMQYSNIQRLQNWKLKESVNTMAPFFGPWLSKSNREPAGCITRDRIRRTVKASHETSRSGRDKEIDLRTMVGLPQHSIPFCTPFQVQLNLLVKAKQRTMISRIAVVLAVALPLLLCLIILLIACTILHLRFRRHLVDCLENLRQADENRARLETKLAAFPKMWDGQSDDVGFGRPELQESYAELISALNAYTRKWIDNNESPSSSGNESPARIEAVLFPEPRRPCFLNTGKDTRFFDNPHQYTMAEICTFIEDSSNRELIFFHIVMSILLKATSFEGDRFQCLLPLSPDDIYGLDKLQTVTRGVECMPICYPLVKIEKLIVFLL